MDKSNTKTVEEQVGKIIANTLLKRESVYLPEVGSFVVDMLSSKIEGKKITAPRNVVKFSQGESGISIIDIIVHVASCPEETAAQVYSKWLDAARRDGGVEIQGVGVVADGEFTPASEIDAILNPASQKSLELKQRKGSWGWIVASVVVCVIVGLAINFCGDIFYSEPVVVEPVEVAVEPVVEQEPVVQVPVVVEEAILEPVIEGVNLRHRVVYGVFSNMENAQKGAALAKEINAAASTAICPMGELFLVSIFSSDSVDECHAFVAESGAGYSELWVRFKRGE